MKLSLLMLGLVSLFGASPAHADSVYITAWQQVFNGGSQTFWTFGPGLKGPAPVDPSAQDFAYYGYQPTFTVEDYALSGTSTPTMRRMGRLATLPRRTHFQATQH
jgi:hypothetical protein